MAEAEEGADELKQETPAEGVQDDAAVEAAETVVTIGDEAPKEEALDNSAVRQMRNHIRELERQNRELKRSTSPAIQALGKEPSLADFEYDEEKFKPAWTEWARRAEAVNAEQERIKKEQQTLEQAFQSRLHAYEASKTAMRLPNMEDAEGAVKSALDEKQQACIIKYAKNPALVIAALGANPGKLSEFASKKDLGEFVYALADVEKVLKVTKKTSIPEPEKRMTGETTAGGTAGGTLEKLREQGAEKGDLTEVLAYTRKQRQAAA